MTEAEIASIKRALSDPWAVCAALGLAEGAKRQASGLSIRCPLHQETNASCSITRSDSGGIRVRCFAGCDFGGRSGGGDVIALVAAAHGLHVRRDFRRAVEIAAGLAGMPGMAAPAPPARASAAPAPPPDLSAAWAALPPPSAAALAYLRRRRLDAAATLCRSLRPSLPGALGAHARAGYELAQAIRDASGRVVAIQARAIDARDDRFRTAGPCSAGLLGDPLRASAAKALLVAEGWADCLAASASAAGSDLAVVGIAGVHSQAALWSLPLAGKLLLIATDADEAGDKAARAIAAGALRAGARPARARPPAGQDLADLHAGGSDLLAFFRAAARKARKF